MNIKITNRRDFLKTSSVAAASLLTLGSAQGLIGATKPALFKISLAEWSLHKAILGKAMAQGWEKFGQLLKNDFDAIEKDAEMKNIDFPAVARKMGFEAIELVNTCFFDKANKPKYLADLKNACDSEGVKSLLIMCDAEGTVGAVTEEERIQTLENHKKWIDAAAFLSCHSIRVNAASSGSFEEQQKLAAAGLRLLCEYGEKVGINILVENHGGLSSNGKWLSGVMKMVNHKNIGTLPDFGNFFISRQPVEEYDRYQGMKELMPFAKGVSAKANDFDAEGNEINSDYYRIMKIVIDAGYNGYVGIEYEGNTLTEKEGIMATKTLLEKVMLKL